MDRSSSSLVRSPAPVHRIHDMGAPAKARPVDFVIISGPGTSRSLDAYVRACECAGLSVKLIGDGHTEVAADMLEALCLEGCLSDETEVIMNMHGGIAADGKHTVMTTLGESMPRSEDLLSLLRHSGEKPWGGRFHLPSCFAGEFRKALDPEGGLWKAGECFVYGSKSLSFPDDDLVEMIRFRGVAKKHEEVPSSTELFRHLADAGVECVSLVGGELEAPLIAHPPKTLTDLRPGAWEEAIIKQQMGQDDGESMPRVGGSEADINRLLAVPSAPAWSADLLTGQPDRTSDVLGVRVALGDFARVSELLQDSDVREQYGLPLLRGFVREGYVQGVKLLLEAGLQEDVDFTDPSTGRSLLHEAVACGHANIVRCLCEAGANPQSWDHLGSSPLHTACSGEDLTIAFLLIEHGLHVDTLDLEGRSSLHMACASGNSKMVKLLIERGADIDQAADDGTTPADLIGQHPPEEILKVLEELEAAVDAAEEVRGLIEGNADAAVLEKVLLEHLSAGYVQSVAEILTAYPDLVFTKSTDGRDLLSVAVAHGHLSIVRGLLNSGLSIDMRDNYENSVLHAAVEAADLNVITLLIAFGAKLGARNDVGDSPLHDACAKGNLEIASALIAAGAEVNAENSFGGTPLREAVRSGNHAVAELLIHHGAITRVRPAK